MGFFTPVIREYLREVLHYAKGKLLDVGCGNKPYESVFRYVDKYIGIDRPSYVDANRLNILERKRSIDVIANADTLPFMDSSFDTVLATQLIEHLSDPDLFFKETTRVLKPEGFLIVTFPLINPVHEEPYDYFRFTEYGVRSLCEKQGLQVKMVKMMGGGWLAIGYLARDLLYENSRRSQKRLKALFFSFLGSFFYGILRKLDRIDFYPKMTLNYLLVAVKPM